MAPVFPEISVALTEKLCIPSDKLLYDLALVQFDQLPESILHWKVSEVSSVANRKRADWLFVGLLGPDEILAAGPERSIVQL